MPDSETALARPALDVSQYLRNSTQIHAHNYKRLDSHDLGRLSLDGQPIEFVEAFLTRGKNR